MPILAIPISGSAVRYLSPFTLLDCGGTPPAGPQLQEMMRLARKRWLVEAELSGSGFVSIHGADYSKDHLLELLEELNDRSRYGLHAWIYSQRSFCRFMEGGEASFFYWKQVRDAAPAAEYLRFAEPLFSKRLVEAHATALRNRDAAAMWSLREIRIPRKDAVLDTLYDKLLDILYHHLEEYRVNLEALESDGALSPALDVVSEELVNTWNALPSDLESVRDDLAELYLRAYRALAARYPAHFMLARIAECGAKLSCGTTGRIMQARLQRLYSEDFEVAAAEASPQENEKATTPSAASFLNWKSILDTASRYAVTLLSLAVIGLVVYVMSYQPVR